MNGIDTSNYSHIQNFLSTIIAEFGVSINTVEAYEKDLIKFSNFIEQSFINVTIDDLLRYRSHLLNKGFADNTISRHISSIKSFYKFLLSEQLIDINPSIDITATKTENHNANILSAHDVTKLIQISYQDTSLIGMRSCLMIEILYASGLRVSELINLRFEDLQFNSWADSYSLTFIGKGNKERCVPIHNRAADLCKTYKSLLSKEYHNITQRSWIFGQLSSNYKKNLTRQSVNVILKKIAAKAGLDDRNVSPHAIRRTLATELLNNNADIMVVKEILGHVSVSTTQIYTKVSIDNLSNAVYKRHPWAEGMQTDIDINIDDK